MKWKGWPDKYNIWVATKELKNYDVIILHDADQSSELKQVPAQQNPSIQEPTAPSSDSERTLLAGGIE